MRTFLKTLHVQLLICKAIKIPITTSTISPIAYLAYSFLNYSKSKLCGNVVPFINIRKLDYLLIKWTKGQHDYNKVNSENIVKLWANEKTSKFKYS